MTDFSGSTNFLALALMVLVLNGTYYKRQIVLTTFTALWAVRLASFLLIRVLIRGKDDRFDEMRSKFWSFLGFWIFQMIWVFTVSLPVTLNNAAKHDKALNYLDYVGWAFWIIGFLCETVADIQKFNHNMIPSDSRPPFLATGLWSVSRHPNYFGEILLWTGIFISSCNAYNADNEMRWGYLAVLSPVLTFLLLMFLSGIPLAEQKSDQRYGKLAQYIDYKRSTSPLIPFPPQLYRRLPNAVKEWLFFEFPIYNKYFETEYQSTDQQN